MSADDEFPCEDERCAIYLHEIDAPYMCLHFDNNAEAIDYWGKVARGELEVDDVIEPYREHLDFSEATSLSDHFDSESTEWTGPTESIEVRANHEVVKTFTAYPNDGGTFPGFETVKRYAEGYAEGYAAGFGRSNR